MKHALAIMLAVSFTALAVFGVFAMHHDMGYGHMGCLATATAAQTCPLGGALSIFLFHAETFKYFSLATVYECVAALLSLAIVLGIAVRLLHEDTYHKQLSFAHLGYFFVSPLLSSAYIMRWLALHENSPSFA